MDRIELKAAWTVSDTGEIEGLAWPFGSADRVGDVIQPGAFAKAIGPIPMLAFHDQKETVGVWDTITETAQGLVVKGRLLINEVTRAKEILALVKEKALPALSIGFQVPHGKAKARGGGGRTISELDLLEISIVAIGAHPGALITSAKGARPGKEGIMPDNEQVAAPEIAELETKMGELSETVKGFGKFTDRLDQIEAKVNRPVGKVEKQDEDLETKALNQYLRNGQVDADLKTLVVGTPASGGYTVAPEYSTNIVKKLVELSPMRRLASVMSIGTGKVFIPTLATDAAGGWVTEIAARDEDEPTFGQIEIDVHEHAVIIPISRQLLEDSIIDLSGLLADRIAIKFAQAENTAFVKGTGTGQPQGLLAAANTYTSVTAKPDASDLLAKIVELYYTLPTPYAQSATWGMTRATMGKIRAAADLADSRTGIWSDGLADGTPARLLGAPVTEFPDMDDFAASKTVAVFGDFSNYQIVDRVGLDIMRDDYTGADNGIVKFRARRRVGGKLLLADAFRTLKTSAT